LQTKKKDPVMEFEPSESNNIKPEKNCVGRESGEDEGEKNPKKKKRKSRPAEAHETSLKPRKEEYEEHLDQQGKGTQREVRIKYFRQKNINY